MELILVEVKLRGPRSESVRNLVLDTGAAATTLIPEVVDDLGYSARDGNKPSRVHSAIGEEHGYSLNVAEFSALGVTTPNFTVNVFDLDHEGFDGLLGMSCLLHSQSLPVATRAERSSQRRRLVPSAIAQLIKGLGCAGRNESRPLISRGT